MSTETPKPNFSGSENQTPPDAGGRGPDDTIPAPTEASDGTSPFSASESSLAGLREIPGYELQRELGRGAMGIVFQAVQIDLKRVVALKMILAGTQAGWAEVLRFRNEAQAAARLEHFAIVPIYDVGQHDGHHYFSMKLIDGGSLAARIEEFGLVHAVGGGSADLAERQRKIATLLAKVAEAIQCAHDAGILHRDLKPGNILIDSRGEPHVADFGLAKRVEGDSVLTQTGVIIGTPSYMAPEQARGQKDLTGAADIYSLGAILYELLTGRAPFKGTTIMETLVQVLEREPASPRTVNASVSRDLETICLKALAKEPGKRFASAAEMARELRRYAAGEPIQTRPPGWTEVFWNRCKRNPVVAGLIATILLLTLTSAGLVLHFVGADPVPRSDGSADRVKAAGKLVIGIDTNYPPMEFLKEGKLAGFDHDLAEQIALKLGVQPEFQIVRWNWPEVPEGLKARKCDMVISSWTITSQRKEEVAFVEYLRLVQVFVCRRGTTVRTEQDLAGKIAVVGADTVQHKYVKSLTEKGIAFKEIIVLSRSEDMFPHLKKGLAEVTIVDEPVGRYHASLDPNLVVTGSVGHAMNPDPIGIVFRHEDRQLQAEVARIVQSMKDDGSFGTILDKWFGK